MEKYIMKLKNMVPTLLVSNQNRFSFLIKEKNHPLSRELMDFGEKYFGFYLFTSILRILFN